MLDEKNYDDLQALSTEELEALIQADWQCDSKDGIDKVYRALTILESRGALGCGSVDVDAAWQEFQSHYNSPEGKKASLYPIQTPAVGASAKKARRVVWKPLSAVAAIFTLVLILAVPVFGEKNLIQYVGQWTKEHFSFSDGSHHSGYTEEGSGDITFKNTELVDVYMEVAMQGCDERVVPTWIPDGFSLSELYSAEQFSYIKVYSFFEKGDKTLTLEYSILTGDDRTGYRYEKSNDEVTVENIAGIDHYFFRNASQYVCVWMTDGVECFIGGNISQEELRKIVHSIYLDVETIQEDNDSQNQALPDLSLKVVAQGCNATVVPTWVPEGFSLIELSTSETPWDTIVHALFENGEKTLSITYLIPTMDTSAQGYYEKSNDEVIVEKIAGIDHYFFRNASRYVCVWMADGIECSISLSGSQEDLRKIVYSIYADLQRAVENASPYNL